MQTIGFGSIQLGPEESVDKMLATEMACFHKSYDELAKLPADPSEKLDSKNSLLYGAGVDLSSDYSDIIMGAIGKFGFGVDGMMDAAAQKAGFHVGSEAASGGSFDATPSTYDFAKNLLFGISEERENGNKLENKKDNKKEPGAKCGATSMFRTRTFKKANQPKPMPATHMAAMMRLRRIQIKNAAKKRKEMKAAMDRHLEKIKELMVFVSCGIKSVHVASAHNIETGQTETYLVAAADKPHMALRANGKTFEKPIDVSMIQKPSRANAPQMAMGF